MNDTNPLPVQTEEQIPAIAQLAFARAYQDALAAGHSVMVAENGIIAEIFPDGSRKEIKRIQPHIPVTAGQVITLQ